MITLSDEVCQVKMSRDKPCERQTHRNKKCIFHLKNKSIAEINIFEKEILKELERLEKDNEIKEIDFTGFIFPNAIYFKEHLFEKKIIFREVHFNKVDFSGAHFKEVFFTNSIFHGEADFNEAFFNEAHFYDSQFIKDVEFRNARFYEEANFNKTKFNGRANFDEAHFGEVYFTNAQFNKVYFYNAIFNKKAYFGGSHFEKGAFRLAHFNNVDFGGTYFEEVDFREVHFNEEAYFVSLIFNKEADFYKAIFNRFIFHGVIINKYIRFSYSEFLSEASFADLNSDNNNYIMDFRNVTFYKQRNVIFQSSDLSNVSFLNTDVTGIQFLNEIWNNRDGRLIVVDEIRIGKDEYTTYSAVAQLYRRLRKNYENCYRFAEAGNFFIGEMEMRRLDVNTNIKSKQIRDIVLWFKRNFSLLGIYKHICLYGESYLLPVIWAVIVIFSYPMLVHWLFNASLPQSDDFLYTYLRTSAASFFQLESKYIGERIIGFLLLGLLFMALKRQFERKK